MNQKLKEAYLAFADILDRHEEFNEDEIKEYVGLCRLAMLSFEDCLE